MAEAREKSLFGFLRRDRREQFVQTARTKIRDVRKLCALRTVRSRRAPSPRRMPGQARSAFFTSAAEVVPAWLPPAGRSAGEWRQDAVFHPLVDRRSPTLNGEIISDHIFRSIVQERRTRRPAIRCPMSMEDAIFSTSSECCATEKMCGPVVWPFQRATRARPCRVRPRSDVERRGIEQEVEAPDSIRCQGAGATHFPFQRWWKRRAAYAWQ